LWEKQNSIQAQYPKAKKVLRATAPRNLIVHGGLKSSRSRASIIAGIAWKPKSGRKGNRKSSGNTSPLSIKQSPQYNMLMRTSNGVEMTETVFLALNSVRLNVKSAKNPRVILVNANASPMMVRNWKLPPNFASSGLGKMARYRNEAENDAIPSRWTIAERDLDGDASF
jgi:hypothetical protein